MKQKKDQTLHSNLSYATHDVNRSGADIAAPWLVSLPGPLRVHTLQASLDSDRQTAQTVGLMTRHVREALRDWRVQRAVQESGARAPNISAGERAGRIFHWVRSHVAFRQDPPDDELLITPPALLAMRPPTGDCDDFSMLTAAMLTLAGLRPTFVTVAADPGEPGRFSHVYVEVRTERGPTPVDASHGPFLGWSAAMEHPVTRARRWPAVFGPVMIGAMR